MLVRTLHDIDVLIAENLHRIREIPFDVIVHLPRSGTIPAAILSTYISKPLASVSEYLSNQINTRKCDIESSNRILLVDDSIRTGKQMTDAILEIQRRKSDTVISTLSVFSTKTDRRFQPTMFLSEHDDVDYIYPWFMWKTKRIAKCAVDMDGVLCRDCRPDEDDDGEKYLKFLETAEPKFLTKYKIGAIITSRLEKYRPQTEEWLARHGITYGDLVMGEWRSKEERRGKQAVYKAYEYAISGMKLYIESSAVEAPIIAQRSNNPVWCIDTMRLY